GTGTRNGKIRSEKVKTGVRPTGFDHHLPVNEDLFSVPRHARFVDRTAIVRPIRNGISAGDDDCLTLMSFKRDGSARPAGVCGFDRFPIHASAYHAGVPAQGNVRALLNSPKRRRNAAGITIAARGRNKITGGTSSARSQKERDKNPKNEREERFT